MVRGDHVVCIRISHALMRTALSDPSHSAGGAHTTASMMDWWTLAMLAHPETQERAQRELDAIVGRARVPTFADMPHLPYICAMVKEVLRWGPVVPLGL